ncbi:acyl-CoA dehydrogenase [Gammaproteobacteria bacterium 45_16_T64]|nr:acyl-CoA dehydrogenase [Gammaproteobacteria bacterium 45_16_T64]
MEFAFTEEQLMIRDTAESFLKEVSTSEAIRTAMATDAGFDADLWKTICTDLYWQAIHIPEEFGGMGLGYVELVAMMEQMGRFLLCSPFFSTVCLGANALIIAGTEEQKALYLPQICEGKTATLAYTGLSAARSGGQWGAQTIDVVATSSGDEFVLNGTVRFVPDGASADILVIAARTAGSVGRDGVSLFVIPSDTAGVQRTLLKTMDQTRKQAEIVLDNVTVSASALMSKEGEAWTELSTVIDLATVALAAEQMGGAQQIMDMTVEYTKERTQFNRPIAGFQAIKHMAADMMTRVEVARSGVYYAACVAQDAFDLAATGNTDGEFSAELPEAASIAKSYCSDTYFKNAGDSIQMHGGVGFTWEYDVHLHFKRAKATEHQLGNGAYHRERIASLLLD